MKQNVLTSILADQTARYGDREAFSAPNSEGQWEVTSWRQFNKQVNDLARAFVALGLDETDKVTVFSANRPQVLVTDFAAYACRMSPISIYATSSLDQVEYIARDCDSRMMFVGDEKQLEIALKALANCPSIKKIVVYDPSVKLPDNEMVVGFEEVLSMGGSAPESTHEEVARRTAAVKPDDIATIVYTSGTTGEPKGAVLPHSCFTSQLQIHRDYLTMLSDADTSLCFLPLSHIFEKAWTYFCLYIGIRISINVDPHAIQQTITQRRPSCMCSVPRFWEKVYTAIQGKLSTMTGPRKWIAMRAISVGRKRNLEYLRCGLKVPRLLEWQYKFYYKQVLLPVQRIIGVENGNIYPTAGAPLSPAITEFFRSLGIPVMIGYGLSETTATVSCYPPVDYQIGSVGTAIPNVEVKIGDDNEILVKGPTVMREYYGKPEATAEAFTADGWFRTGDAGRIDDDGSIYLTERIKDLFKTSNGKYIAPQVLESQLGEDPCIEQVAIIGDQRKYVSALIVPNFEALKKYAAEKGINYFSTDDLVKNTAIHRMIAERIERLQKNLASFERIKKFTLLPEEFTMERGELTNTLKIKRPVINKRYASEIEAMYD